MDMYKDEIKVTKTGLSKKTGTIEYKFLIKMCEMAQNFEWEALGYKLLLSLSATYLRHLEHLPLVYNVYNVIFFRMLHISL